MRSRTWNSWTQFETIDGPTRRKVVVTGSPLHRSNAYQFDRTPPADFRDSPKRHRGSVTDRSTSRSEVRTELIARLKAAIENHTYFVSAADLSQKILQAVLGSAH